MSAISATTPSIGAALAQLISNGASDSQTPAAPSSTSAAPSSTASTSGPATFVSLSDQAKAAAAAKATADQTAADNLQAYVDAHRVTGNGTAPTDLQSASTQPTSTSKVAAIVAQIKTVADANEPPPFQPFTPTKSLSNSVTVDGYTLSLDTNASTQFYGYTLSGNGSQVFNDHFGPSDGAGGGSGAAPGVAIGEGYVINNNEALDSITISQNVATVSSASESSSAGSVSASSVNAQSSSITFLVDYATGQIGVEQSAVSVSAQAARTSPPGSTLSTLA